MNQKLVKGCFVIVVREYADTQYGHKDREPELWCVSAKKYCSSLNTVKIRKFDSHEDAQDYIDALNPKYRKQRKHEIQYLSHGSCGSGNVLSSWHEVSSTKDALKIDLDHVREKRGAFERVRDRLKKTFPQPRTARQEAQITGLETDIKKLKRDEARLGEFVG